MHGTVAHVWDEEAEKWWRFDDETVAEMPKGPVGERGDHGVAAEKKASPTVSNSSRSITMMSAVCNHMISCAGQLQDMHEHC